MSNPPTILVNPSYDPTSLRGQGDDSPTSSSSAYTFHRTVLPGYAPTALLPLQTPPSASKRFRGRVYLKAENDRYTLPAFKVLGAAWASFLSLCDELHLDAQSTTLDALRTAISEKRAGVGAEELEMVAATDGNHGGAVAWFASLVGIRAHIFTPGNVSPPSRARIRSMGAQVCVTHLADLDYDAAVQRAAAYAADATSTTTTRLLIQDTAWEGYTTTPQHIVDGYTTIFTELDQQLHAAAAAAAAAVEAAEGRNGGAPSHVIVPVGVGSLAQAVVQHYHQRRARPDDAVATRVVSVEPTTAACLSHSLLLGRNEAIETGETIMPGLNCGTVSDLAWPSLRTGIAAAVQVDDAAVETAMRHLEAIDGVVAGPCGAAPFAALSTLLENEDEAQRLGLLDRDDVSVVLLMTEGKMECE